ncbi:MAG: transposase, partial [Phycisphaerae bacterium]
MGERQLTLFPLDFNRAIRIEGRPERLTGDAGVLALRQIDHQLGLTEWLARHLIDPRNQELITHPFVELLRSRLYLIAHIIHIIGGHHIYFSRFLGLRPGF